MKKAQKPKSGPPIRCAHSDMAATDSLQPNPQNPNTHPPAQLSLYARILRHQGWRKAIVVSNQSGLIVTGHGAWLTARAEGWPRVPVDRQDFPTPADETAHLLADNGLPQMAGTDAAALKKLLRELDADLRGLTGFDAAELESLLADTSLKEVAIPPPAENGLGPHRHPAREILRHQRADRAARQNPRRPLRNHRQRR